MRTTFLALMAGLLALGATCGVINSGYTSTPALDVPKADIIKTLRKMIASKGFPLECCDEENGILETDWKTTSGVYHRQTLRHRAEFVVRTPDDGGKGWIVDIKVLKQENDNSWEPSNLARAAWISAGRDEEEEFWFSSHLTFKLDPDLLKR